MLFNLTRSPLSALTAFVLAGALLSVAPSAHASVSNGYLGSEIDLEVVNSGGNSTQRLEACDQSDYGDEIEEDVSDDGQLHSQRLNMAATISETGQTDRTVTAATIEPVMAHATRATPLAW